MELRPRLRSARGGATGPRIDMSAVTAVPLSTALKPLELDPLTVADDRDFLDAVELQRNLPPAVRTGLSFMALNRPSPAGKRQSCLTLFTAGDSKPATIKPCVHSSGSL